jgi:GNAT superfamily N-acetyltransferase
MAEVDAAYELAARVFGPDYFTSRAHKVRLRDVDPVRRPDEAVVVVRDGEVVGFVRLVERAVWLGEATLAVGGITSVCVHPDVQGLGYGRLVMEEAVALSRRRGDVLSIAFARRAVDGFYPRLGYLGLGCHPDLTLGAVPSGLASAESAAGFDAASIPTYAAAYRASYRPLPLAFARDDGWWPCFSRRLEGRLSVDGFVNVAADGERVGYFVTDGARIVEAAALRDREDAVLGAIVRHAGGRPVVLALPPAHWAMHALQRVNHTLKIRYAWDGGHVVRPLAAAPLGDALRRLGADQGVSGDFTPGDLLDHEAARALLDRVAGLDGAPALLPSLPAWSMVDEF